MTNPKQAIHHEPNYAEGSSAGRKTEDNPSIEQLVSALKKANIELARRYDYVACLVVVNVFNVADE